jgi:hypothetical protein
MDEEAGPRGDVAVSKTCRQTTRDTLLFCFAAGTAFGVFWYGVTALIDGVWGRDTELKFFVAAAVGAFTCAVAHECFFRLVPKLEARLGGRVIYRPVDGTSRWKASIIALCRDELGGFVFLGLTEAVVAALPPTGNKGANVARVTCSFILGFALWYLYEEWLQRWVASLKAVREDAVEPVPMTRTVLNVTFKFAVVFVVSYTNRWMERSFTGLHLTPPTERFNVAFTGNLWFIFLWFRLYDLSHWRIFRP